MSVSDKKVLNTAGFPVRTLVGRLISAVSQTRVPFYVKKLQFDVLVTIVEFFASVYTAVLSVDVVLVGADAVLSKGTLLISGVSAVKFKTTTPLWWFTGGVLKTKAATDNLTFGTAYTVNNALGAGTAHWGAFLIQVDAAGAVTGKAITQDQDYATEALAIAALPKADASKVAFGYITVQAKTGGVRFTADTTDMTPASGVTAANFYDIQDARSVIAAGITAMALGNQEPALSATFANKKGSAGEFLCMIYTSDGAGAVTNGEVQVSTRPYPLSNEA